MRVKYPFFLLLAVIIISPVRSLARSDVASDLINVPALRTQAAAWLEQRAMTAFPAVTAAAEVGEVDSRLRFPSCAETRFFLPANAQLWGRGSLGVRCEAPSPWSFYLSYRNRLSGPALVATRPLTAREAPVGTDIEVRQVEYTQSPDLYPRALPPDARLNRPVAAGQPLLIGWLSLPTVIHAGRPVRLQTRTPAFTVSQEGIALGNAAPGDSIRVKTPGGRIVHGTARQDGTVEVRP